MSTKSLRQIMKEADRLCRSKDFPILFLDTSAIIDICKSAREEELRQRKNKDKAPLYETFADHFLMNLAGKYQTVVSPLVYSETKKHYDIRCNSHVREICKETYPLIKKFSEDYGRLEKSFLDKVFDDTERYDVYWTSKLCCNDNAKKQSEGFSDADRELLTRATLFSKYFEVDDKKVDSVVVLSSDEHVIKGTKMLNGLGYDNIIPLFTKNVK